MKKKAMLFVGFLSICTVFSGVHAMQADVANANTATQCMKEAEVVNKGVIENAIRKIDWGAPGAADSLKLSLEQIKKDSCKNIDAAHTMKGENATKSRYKSVESDIEKFNS